MLTVKFNEEDIQRILGRLNATLAQSKGYTFQWRIKLLKQYKQQVITAMGTVTARGGYPHITFDAASGYVKWRSLRPYTIRAKLEHRGTPRSEYSKKNPSELYKTYASELSIWVDTGQTRESVTINGNFAGIEDSSVLDKAHDVEEGDPARSIPKRPLFAVANFAIITTIHNMLQNGDSWLAKAMRREFCSLARSNGWGS